MVALLKRFRPEDIDIIDEEVMGGEIGETSLGSTRSSRILPPTEKELEEMLEELENYSDSGPELEPDKVSIVSQPRPRLRPFFGSKLDLPPAEMDDALEEQEESDGSDEAAIVEELVEGIEELMSSGTELEPATTPSAAQLQPQVVSKLQIANFKILISNSRDPTPIW